MPDGTFATHSDIVLTLLVLTSHSFYRSYPIAEALSFECTRGRVAKKYTSMFIFIRILMVDIYDETEYLLLIHPFAKHRPPRSKFTLLAYLYELLREGEDTVPFDFSVSSERVGSMIIRQTCVTLQQCQPCAFTTRQHTHTHTHTHAILHHLYQLRHSLSCIIACAFAVRLSMSLCCL